MMIEESDIRLTQQTLKNLIDKSQQRRQAGHKQVELLVEKYLKRNYIGQIAKVIAFFKERYVRSFDINLKIVGLQIMPHILHAVSNSPLSLNAYSFVICNIILESLSESENKVRWAALKSLYYVADYLKEKMMPLFNLIFEKIIGSVNDTDESVRNAANFLDQKLKNLLISCLQNGEEFSLLNLISIIKSKLKSMNVGVRQYLIKWVNNLFDFNLLFYLPDLLQDMLFMLSDKDSDLKVSVEQCLNSFEKDIVDKFNENKLQNITKSTICQIITILIRVAKGKHPSYTKLHTLGWFKVIFILFKQEVDSKNIKKTPIFKNSVVEKFDEILQPILVLMSHEEEEVRKQSINVNDMLMKNILMVNQQETINFGKVIPLLKDMLSEKKALSTSESALRWMKFMLENYNDKILPQIQQIIQKLVQKLSESNVKSVAYIIENTAIRDQYYELLILKMLKLLHSKHHLQQNKVEQVLKKFSLIQDGYRFCKCICQQLINHFEHEYRFVFEIVEHLNHIIVLEDSLLSTRKRLQNLREESQIQNFMTFFSTFRYNPPSLVSLCFLSQQYELAYNIILTLAQTYRINDLVLLGFCKLASLIESSGFLFLRMQLRQNKHFYLNKSLKSLLMILPQGTIFNMLKNRISISKQFSISPPTCENKISESNLSLYLELFKKIDHSLIK